jgi:hypothetical protein
MKGHDMKDMKGSAAAGDKKGSAAADDKKGSDAKK